MTRTWKIEPNKTKEVHFTDASSLDAITRGLPNGYYSTFRTYNGCTHVLGLKAHLRRLPNIDASSLRRQLTELLEPYRPDEARVRVMMTFNGQVYISIEPLRLLPREVYEKGVRVETAELHRKDPRIKATAFIGASDSERRYLAQAGLFEALLVKNGKILEGMTSNFFYVLRPEWSGAQSKDMDANALRLRDFDAVASQPSAQRGILYTAQRDILLGVTRRTVIRVARGRGVEVRYSPLNLDQLSAVSEAFITSSSRGIVPVIQVDEVTVGEGGVGELTQMLMSAYEENVVRMAEKI